MFIGLATFMPNSPRQLIRKGKIEEARGEFVRIRRDLNGVAEAEVVEEFAVMMKQIEFEVQQEDLSYRQIFVLFKHRVLV